MKKRTKENGSKNNDWETPDYIKNYIIKKYGSYFDPCPINARFDGLKISWKKVNYINPPYNRKDKEAFIRKAHEESKKGKICVMLLPVSTSTKIFHEIILPNAKVEFLKGIVKFRGVNSKGERVENKCGQHDSMVVVFPKDLE